MLGGIVGVADKAARLADDLEAGWSVSGALGRALSAPATVYFEELGRSADLRDPVGGGLSWRLPAANRCFPNCAAPASARSHRDPASR